MPKNKKEEIQKIPVTVNIDQTLWADFQDMLAFMNGPCDCPITHPTMTLEYFLEAWMKQGLRQFHIDQALRKYE